MMIWKKGTVNDVYCGPNDYFESTGKYNVKNYSWSRNNDKFVLYKYNYEIYKTNTLKNAKMYAEKDNEVKI